MSDKKANDLEEINTHTETMSDWPTSPGGDRRLSQNNSNNNNEDSTFDPPGEDNGSFTAEFGDNVSGTFSASLSAAGDNASRRSTPVSSCMHTPNLSRAETPVLSRLDLSHLEAQLAALPLDLSSSRFLSIQDISEMETPFLSVPPLPESPTEAPLLPPMQLLTGLPPSASMLDFSDGGGIHSCLSSASHLASGLSTPLTINRYKSSDSDCGTDLLPVCRICQLPGDKEDFLFSPCRCSGTMMFVHYLCLLKWIEISTRKTKRQPRCELCHFQYVRHKRFKFRRWRLPRVSRRDKFLHTVFFINLLIMLGCAVATILCFLSDKGHLEELPRGRHPGDRDKQIELTSEEIITLICGIMFFVSFFVAMTVEIKAKHTIYRLFLRFISHNTEWQIEPYQRAKDLELQATRPPHSYV